MGHVMGDVVAAAFGCFNPKVVAPAVEAGWQITGRQAILDAREQAATAMLQRVLGDDPEGLAALARRGPMTDAEQLTDAGRALREEVEVRTDELDGPCSTHSAATST